MSQASGSSSHPAPATAAADPALAATDATVFARLGVGLTKAAQLRQEEEVNIPRLARAISVYAKEDIKRLLQRQYQNKYNLYVDFPALLAEAQTALHANMPKNASAFVDAYIQARLARDAAALQKRLDMHTVLTCPFCETVIPESSAAEQQQDEQKSKRQEDKSADAADGDDEAVVRKHKTLREISSAERQEVRCPGCENTCERCVAREATDASPDIKTEIQRIMKTDYMRRHHFDVLWQQAKRALLQAKPRPKNPYAFLAAFMRSFDDQIRQRGADLVRQAIQTALNKEAVPASEKKTPFDHLIESLSSQLSNVHTDAEERVFHKVTPMRWKTAGRINEDYLQRHRLDEWWKEHAVIALNHEMPQDPFMFLAERLDITADQYAKRIEAAYERKQAHQKLLDEKMARFSATAIKEQPEAVGLAEQLMKDASRLSLAEMDKQLSAMAAQPGTLIRLHQALGMLDWMTLNRLRNCRVFTDAKDSGLRECVSNKAMDRAIKRQDDRLRVLFIQQRSAAEELKDLHVGCVDVYGNEDMFVAEDGSDVPKVCDWTPHLPAGSPAVVDRVTFERRFRSFTFGVLEGLDWSNTIVAGGSVMAAVKPSAHQNHPYEFHTGPDANLYAGSDIDLFFYDLTPEQANAKIEYLDKFFRTIGQRTISREVGRFLHRDVANTVAGYIPHEPREVLIVRTPSAVTWTLEYPQRHVQVVLRLYKSPAEVILGFDVDSCSICYDGVRVWATPRAVRSLVRGYNLIDLDRRSYTYETRLLKYSLRGFAVGIPGFDRRRVDASIFKHKFNEVKGLARLLLLERKKMEELGAAALRAPARGEPRRPQHNAISEELVGMKMTRRRGMARNGEGILRAPFAKADLKERIEEFEDENEVRAEEYSSVFLPWGPDWQCNDVFNHLRMKYFALNPGFARRSKKDVRICPCFFFWTVDKVFKDVWHMEAPRQAQPRLEEMKDSDVFVVGDVEWMEIDPGRQMVGSFYPITNSDWTKGAYLPEGASPADEKAAPLAAAVPARAAVTDELVANLLMLALDNKPLPAANAAPPAVSTTANVTGAPAFGDPFGSGASPFGATSNPFGGGPGVSSSPAKPAAAGRGKGPEFRTPAQLFEGTPFNITPAAAPAPETKTAKPDSKEQKDGGLDQFVASGMSDDSWICNACNLPNFSGQKVCNMCGTVNMKPYLGLPTIGLAPGFKESEQADDGPDEEEKNEVTPVPEEKTGKTGKKPKKASASEDEDEEEEEEEGDEEDEDNEGDEVSDGSGEHDSEDNGDEDDYEDDD